MAWQRVGSVSVGPVSKQVTVGSLSVPPQGGVELMVRETSPEQPFEFAFGLVSFRSQFGRELGTIKCWGNRDWTAYKLGAGLSAQARSGELIFEPRSYNLRWVQAGFPWSLEFMADLEGDLPADRYQSIAFVNAQDRTLPVVRVGTQGRIQF
jgi:hypothetical protein